MSQGEEGLGNNKGKGNHQESSTNGQVQQKPTVHNEQYIENLQNFLKQSKQKLEKCQKLLRQSESENQDLKNQLSEANRRIEQMPLRNQKQQFLRAIRQMQRKYQLQKKQNQNYLQQYQILLNGYAQQLRITRSSLEQENEQKANLLRSKIEAQYKQQNTTKELNRRQKNQEKLIKICQKLIQQSNQFEKLEQKMLQHLKLTIKLLENTLIANVELTRQINNQNQWHQLLREVFGNDLSITSMMRGRKVNAKELQNGQVVILQDNHFYIYDKKKQLFLTWSQNEVRQQKIKQQTNIFYVTYRHQ